VTVFVESTAWSEDHSLAQFVHPYMSIRQITIVGTGLIGGSLALALKEHGFTGKARSTKESQIPPKHAAGAR
jgi:hypothetical protein